MNEPGTVPPVKIVSCEPAEGFAPRVGRYMTQLLETREALLEPVRSLNARQLSWHPFAKVESIGTQLLHTAAIEWSWVHEEILGRPDTDYDFWEEALPIRLGKPQVEGQSLPYFVERLDAVRAEVMAALRELSDDDLDRLVPEGVPAPGDDGPSERFTIDWVLFHLVHHEAHHAGQIELMVRMLPSDLGPA